MKNFIELINQTIAPQKIILKNLITPIMLLQYSSKVNWLFSSVLVVLGKHKNTHTLVQSPLIKILTDIFFSLVAFKFTGKKTVHKQINVAFII